MDVSNVTKNGTILVLLHYRYFIFLIRLYKIRFYYKTGVIVNFHTLENSNLTEGMISKIKITTYLRYGLVYF